MRMVSTSVRTLLAIGSIGLVVGGCSESNTPLEPGTAPTALLSVVPRGGSTDVDRFSQVVIEFDHAVMQGMEDYALLHEGDVTGAEVAGAWTLSIDRRALTFTPVSALAPGTRYTIHLGGGMMDADGEHVDLGTHGVHMGGAWATPGMMHGGVMGGLPGEHHMGEGWEHPANGSYGMVFSFTTGY